MFPSRSSLCAALLLAGCGCSDEPEARPADGGKADAASLPDSMPLPDASKPDASVKDATADTELFDASMLDAKNDPAYAWLFDDAAWKPLSVVPGCDVREADLGKLKYPGHVWADCGSGCRASEVMPGSGVIFRGAYRYGTGGRPYSGDIHVFMTSGVRFPPGVQVAESFRLGTDVPASVLLVYGDNCKISFSGKSATRLLRVNPYGAGGVGAVALVPLEPGVPVSWPSPQFKLSAYAFFDFDGGWGAIVGQTSVEVTFDFTSTQLTSVYSSPALQNEPRANGDAVVWEDWGAGRVVRGWTKAGGSRVLADGSWEAGQVAISDTRIVWMGVNGPNTISGAYDTARLYWSPRALDPDNIVINAGPVLPAKVSMAAMVTHGKWAALEQYGDQGPAATLVADLETNDVWSIPVAAGHWPSLIAISDTELLLADAVTVQQRSASPAQYLDTLVRYELAKLADYAQKLP